MKSLRNIQKIVIICILIIQSSLLTYGQEYLKEISKADIGGSTLSVSVPKKSTLFGNVSATEAVKVSVQLDMNADGSEYNYGGSSDSYPFEYKLSFSLLAYEGTNAVPGVFDNSIYTITINNSAPKKVWTKDLASLIDNNKVDKPLKITRIEVVNPQLEVIINNVLQSKVRRFIELEVTYAHHIKNNTTLLPEPQLSAVKVVGKSAEFSWEHPYPYTMYQLQLLRLYNTSPLKTSQDKIDANVDWSKAISLEIPILSNFDNSGNLVSNHKTSLTLSEGTGFYAWRVRAVGTYYKGGITSPLNWGNWSVHDIASKALDSKTLTSNYLYFVDPDENKNRIYNRVFTEENKIKEVSTFANGLNQVKQIKTFLPSNNTTMTVQSVTDYSGRAALSTLPMPTEGKVDSYSENFLTSNNATYTAANLIKPKADKTDENGEMNYYKSNSDPRIPDSEGYPFSQTFFYDDPLNRVKEEGAPGNMHMINQDGSGKTVKYFYGTPSDAELVRLFGKEAPKSEKVSKMVKVDPNNIATITYTSSDGKIIATCLSFYDNDKNELEPVSTSAPNSVSNEITQNLKTDWGFVSSKRVVFLQKTDVILGYSINESTLKLNCAQLNLNCSYVLDIVIHNVEKNTTNEIVKNQAVVPVNGVFSLTLNPTSFDPGTYVIEKRLRPAGSQTEKTVLEQNAAGQIEPLVNLIESWLDEVNCEQQVQLFQTNLRDLKAALANRNISQYSGNGFINDFINNVYNTVLPEDASKRYNEFYYLTLYKWNSVEYIECLPQEDADLAVISSLCCNISVPVKWVRQFNINATPRIEFAANGSITQIIPDFEAYALGYLEGCNINLYDNMEGWGKDGDGVPKGTFNLMIYHMLTDVPDPAVINNPIIDAAAAKGEVIVKAKVPVYDGCGNEISNVGNGLYTTKGLFECWHAQLSNLKSLNGCNDFDLDLPTDPLNPASEVDKRNGGDPSEFNNAFENGTKKLSKRRQRRIKKKLSRKMRDLSVDISNPASSSSPVQVHLVKDFLDCAGYSFVKILTPYNPKPLPEDAVSGRNYNNNGGIAPFRYKLANDVSVSSYFSNAEFKRTVTGNKVNDYYYYPLNNWGPQKKNASGQGTGEYLFKNIRNPIYAFKYFEYPQEGMDTYQELETSVCYDDPNDCYQLDGGYIKVDQNGGFVKGPCCESATVPGDYSFCYADRAYPNLNIIYTAGDPRFGTDANGNYKRIVNDFKDAGRLKCPYDHTKWNLGQRYTFFSMLSTYVPPSEEDEEDEGPFKRTCLDVERVSKWYNNEGAAYNPELPDLISQKEKDDHNIFSATPFTTYDVLNSEVPHPNGVSLVEMEMAGSVQVCLDRCTQRIPMFQEAIEKTLEVNCYDVGGCLGGSQSTPQYENVVPREDIEKMVYTMVDMCQSQCTLNTFSCEEITTRKIKTARTELGPNDNYASVLYGMGGFPTDPLYNCDKGLQVQYDDVSKYDLSFVYGTPGVEIHKCKINREGITEDSYSWYQYTLMTQATDWDFELNLPSKCEAIKLEAEDATEKVNVLVTTHGINNFGNGGYIKFTNVDFGRGAVTADITYAVPAGFQGLNIQVRLDSPSGTNIGSFTTTNTANLYTEGTITFNQTVTGLHHLYLVGSGAAGQYVNIDKVLLRANTGVRSNFREFTGCSGTQQGTTYMNPAEYEKEGNIPEDGKGMTTGKPIISPTKSVQITIQSSGI